MKKVIKQFFKSLWEDFVGFFKKHIFRLIAFVISFIVPIAILLTTYVEKVEDKTKWTVPFAVIVPLVILILIYWCKLRRTLAIKIQSLKVENNTQKGKHAGLLILFDFFQVIMTLLPFVLLYIVIKKLEQYAIQFADIMLFMIICESLGGVFTMLDTIKNVVDFEEEGNK